MATTLPAPPPVSAVSAVDASDAPLPYTQPDLASFCREYPELRTELTARGEMIIMPPAGNETSARNAEITADVILWNRQNKLGKAFDSSAGFVFPDGAIRSPDTSWGERSRWEAVPADQRRKFAPVCPDFVLELRSDTDRLSDLQAKMREYIANGVRLGWLIDPRTRRVEVYRPGRDAEVLDDPATLSGEDVLPGFVLDLTRIWT